jgi:hypothetical protein
MYTYNIYEERLIFLEVTIYLTVRNKTSHGDVCNSESLPTECSVNAMKKEKLPSVNLNSVLT